MFHPANMLTKLYSDETPIQTSYPAMPDLPNGWIHVLHERYFAAFPY